MGNLGENIRAARKRAQMTQEALANAVGVKHPAISKWERGDSKPELPTLVRVADILHCSVDALLGRDEVRA